MRAEKIVHPGPVNSQPRSFVAEWEVMAKENKDSGLSKVTRTSVEIGSENLQKLREVLPQFVKDGEVDFNTLKAWFENEGLVAGEEKYGLSWAGKSDAFKAVRTTATGTLSPQKKESKNWDKTGNLFLEGDNLEVLKLLQKQYREQIKMIYIDSPYNTGGDFIYKDNFHESKSDYYERTGQTEGGVRLTSNTESGGRYHSDWLTMMYPRLFLAKNLLKDDGVIFISIDDHEVHNLRHVMDEIFGEENYLNTFCWLNNLKGRQISDAGAAKTYEYILCYAKKESEVPLFVGTIQSLKEFMPSAYKGFDSQVEEDEEGEFVVKNELHNTNSAFNEKTRPSLVFNIHYNPETKEVKFSGIDSGKEFDGFTKIEPKKNNNGAHRYHAWRWSKDKILRDQNNLKFVESNNGYKVYTKVRDHESTVLKDFISDISTTKGNKETSDLFEGTKLFEYPKPVNLLKIFVAQTSDDDLVMDFFAGYGTFAHSVIQQNVEDDGNRKWICVQIPEAVNEDSEAAKAGYKTISEIAQERIRRAGDKIKDDVNSGSKVNLKNPDTDPKEEFKSMQVPDIGFKSFELQESNYREWHELTEEDDEEKLKEQMKLFAKRPLVDNYDEEAVVYEVLVKEGFDLNSKVKQEKLGDLDVWTVTDNEYRLVVSFAKKLTKDQIESLDLGENDTFICFDHALDDETKVNIIRNLNVKVI